MMILLLVWLKKNGFCTDIMNDDFKNSTKC